MDRIPPREGDQKNLEDGQRREANKGERLKGQKSRAREVCQAEPGQPHLTLQRSLIGESSEDPLGSGLDDYKF